MLNNLSAYAANEPIRIPETESGIVLSLAAFIHGIKILTIVNKMRVENYGNLGYFLKSGSLFSKKAFFPSCASSVR